MMYGPQIPAPNRDLANVSPHLPADSTEMRPVTRRVLGSLCVAIGAGVLLNVLAHALLEWDRFASTELLLSNALAVTAALSFLLAGIAVFYRGVVWSSTFVVFGLLLAVLSKWVV